ncbi:MAG: hypothetical protein LBL84_03465, partial [Candidatus Nomurabacteria bacterium]|nr:hypothetical protein [Candidatus Nomurabacteria bacterium]
MSHHKHHKHPVDAASDGSNTSSALAEPPEPVANNSTQSTDTTLPGAAARAPLASQADTLPPVVTTVASPPKKKRRVGLIVGIIAASLVLLLGVSSTLVYALWYQNPEKVVLDAVTNAIRASSVKVTGEFELKNSGSDNGSGVDSVKLTLSEKGNIATYDVNAELAITLADHDKPLVLKGGAILSSEGDIYIKLTGVKDLVEAYIDAYKESIENLQSEIDVDVTKYTDRYDSIYASIEKLAKKVDGEWWRISAKDLSGDYEEYSKRQECLTKVAKQLESDSTMRSDLSDLYSKYRFITIKDELGEKDGNFGYKIEGDTKTATKFLNGLNGTLIYKALNK